MSDAPNGNGYGTHETPFASKVAGVRGRTDLAQMSRAQILAFPDELREELAKPEYRTPFLTGLKAGLIHGDRTCLRLYAEAHKLCGSQVDIAAAIMAAVGAGAHVARQSVDVVRRVESASPADMARAAVEVLEAYAAERGLTWETVRGELSRAEVIEVNGNGGPHGEHG